jgi:hypothetical protein
VSAVRLRTVPILRSASRLSCMTSVRMSVMMLAA